MSEQTSDQTLVAERTGLEAQLPEAIAQDVVRDPRKGYEGYIVQPASLVAFATFLRDEMGYDFLSSVTGVDYLPEQRLFHVPFFPLETLSWAARATNVAIVRDFYLETERQPA